MVKKLLIFDCDGTLLDTLEDVTICFNAALGECGFPTHDLAFVQSTVGGNLEQIVSRLLPPDEATEENVDQVKNAYKRIYAASDKSHTKPYEGILAVLTELAEEGYVLAVNTNKSQTLAEEVLASRFPSVDFAMIAGYDDSRPSKPDPFGVHMIRDECGVDASDAVYIGDGATDLETASRAGVDCIWVSWGQGKAGLRSDPRVARAVDDPSGLISAIAAL